MRQNRIESLIYFYGEGRYKICLQVNTTGGNGVCVFLTGGEKPHMGGTVVASPRIKSSAAGGEMQTPDAKDRTADLWVSSVPGHKDVEAAIPVAKYLAVALNEPVSVSTGIHIEHAGKEEIQLLCENCRRAAELFVKEYQEI